MDKVTTGAKFVVFGRCEFCFVDMLSCHEMPSEGRNWALD
jgi:hypothetical protein